VNKADSITQEKGDTSDYGNSTGTNFLKIAPSETDNRPSSAGSIDTASQGSQNQLKKHSNDGLPEDKEIVSDEEDE